MIEGKYLPDETIKEIDMAGILAENVRLFPIAVDPGTAQYRWSELKDLSGMQPAIAVELASATKRLRGGPSRWRGTFDAVPRPKWVAVESFVSGEWVPALNEPTGRELVARGCSLGRDKALIDYSRLG